MTCTRCGQPITKGQRYYRSRLGAHHRECQEAQKALYLLVTIGPQGFDYPADVKWLAAPPANVGGGTFGEGQALLFKLVDWDCSTNFAKAIESGQLVSDYTNVLFELRLPAMKAKDTQEKRHLRSPDR